LIPLILLLVLAFASEPYRPQFHFSPARNWTNDPNGLVYFDGEYHLFYQYNPFGDTWGHMSWGHAVTRDLLHWQELPVAIPEANGVMIYTGSVVIDEQNTSGFCLNQKPCMVAIYTGARHDLQAQDIAYSNDHGRTWTKYANNPVLDLHMKDFRDPNVFWSSESKQWIMAVSLPDDHKVAIYGSPNLKQWKQVSEFGPAGATSGQWECPDLFQAHVDGDASKTRWVLKVGLNPGSLQGGSGEQYFIGQFDGTTFQNDNPASLTLWTDYGKDCYCALTFNHIPPNRPPIMLGWMNNWQYANQVPTSPWRGQMTVAREVSLKTFPEGIRLMQKPIAPKGTVVRKSIAIPGSGRAGWKLVAPDGAYTSIGYDAERKEIFVDRTHSSVTSFNKDFPARTSAPYAAGPGPINLDIIVDRNSVEVFGGDGRIAITNLVFAPATRMVYFTETK
jgi:sucrose-6-phosphate hydrolase SacC (GH32 family)